MKTVIAIAFVFIIGSLASALFFLMRGRRNDKNEGIGSSRRTMQALALRVGLSVALFALILVAHKLGWIEPTGIAYR
jgi:NADH:ubiquinone oxidoreductase subunit H